MVSGLSAGAQEENLKAKKIEAQLRQSTAETASPTETRRTLQRTPSGIAGEPVTVVSPRGFEEELKATQALLEHGSRSIRMECFLEEHKIFDAEAEEERKRAENLRRRAEQERKLRMAAKAVHDPKRRVQLKIQQRRQLQENDDLEALTTGEDSVLTKVPMQTVHCQRTYGIEHVPVVNVGLIQARSMGLGKDCSKIEDVMTQAEQKERRQRWEHETFGKDSRDYVKKNREVDSLASRTLSCVGATASLRERRLEARSSQVLIRRESVCELAVGRKLKQMRSAWQIKEGNCCSQTAARAIKSIMAEARAEALTEDAERQKPAQLDFTSPCLSPKSTGSGSRSESRQCMFSRDPSAELKRSRTKLNTLLALSPTGSAMARLASAKCLGRWRMLKVCTSLLMLLRIVRRRHKSVAVILDILDKLLAYRETKIAVVRWHSRIRQVRSLCRSFIVRKRLWCEHMAVVWKQCEDLHLTLYSQRCRRELVESGDKQYVEAGEANAGESSPKKAAGRSPSASRSGRRDALTHTAHSLTLLPVFHWKTLRIPPSKRKFALGRWYIVCLQQRIKNQSGWYAASRAAYGDASLQKKDMSDFLRLCGLDEASASASADIPLPPQPGRKPVVASTSAPHGAARPCGEAVLLELIALSAQELRGTEPFQEHPANKDVPGGEISAGYRLRRLLLAATATPSSTLGGTGGHDEHPISPWLGRLQPQRTARSSAEAAPAAEAARGEASKPEEPPEVDMYELWQSFTPRLRQLAASGGTDAIASGVAGVDDLQYVTPAVAESAVSGRSRGSVRRALSQTLQSQVA